MAERRPAHKVAHPPGVCPNGAFNWADCDKAGRKPCSAMLDSRPEECAKWAVAEYEGKGYCGVHYFSRVNREIEDKRQLQLRAELDRRITEHLNWIAEHPSVWDRRSGGGGGESNPASLEVAAPGTETVSAGPAGPTGQLTPMKVRRIAWSALSGDKAPIRPVRP